ncbi:DUF2259 domain-containing protein [Roseibium album]|uniref:DUF2259 domain-containing protein n=1 Tax=Roseibium album TaxID=311410 RepID=UPI00391C2C08
MPLLSSLARIAIRSIPGLLPALVLAGSLANPALAGDTAEAEIYGFSSHGDFFAFEQYGTQDGSGFPYSEIFVLDVIGDTWVKPSPFRRLDEVDETNGYDEEQVLNETRERNQEAARSLLQDKGIFGKGKTVAFNPPTELTANPYKMVVAPRLPLVSGETSIELTLTEYPLKNSVCAGYDVNTKGFRLTMVNNGVTRTLNDDTSVPDSRRCPFAYRIERFFTYYPDQAPPVFAILIQMESLGFEGPDRRYLAITGRL